VFQLLAAEIHKKTSVQVELNHISDFSPFYEIDATWEGSDESKAPRLQPRYEAAQDKLQHQIFNTHLLPDMLPQETGKIIYVMRHARDVAFSFYHHLSNQDEASGGGAWANFDQFMTLWLKGELPYSKWIDHVAKWLTYMEKEKQQRVLLLTYEELSKDLAGTIRKIVSHLDLSLTAAEVDELAPRLTFQGMKSESSKYEPISVKWKEGYSFLRKGVVNDSKSAFYNPDGSCTALGETYRECMQQDLLALAPTTSPSVLALLTALSE
jgi:hypothetical protein